MIRINLMPRAEARRQAARQRDKQVATLIAIGLGAILLVTEFFTRRDARNVQAEAERYQAELTELTKRHMEATLLDKRRAELKAKLATIDVLERQRRGPAHVLDDLSGSTPEKLWLTEVRESGGGLTLIGKGLDNQTIAQFMRKLSASHYFENVDLVETKQIEEGQAKLKQFTVSARVNYAGRSAPPAAAATGEGDGAVAPAGGQAPREADAASPGNGAGAPNGGAPNASPPSVGSAAGGSGPVDGGGPLAGAIAAQGAARNAATVTEGRQAAEASAAGVPEAARPRR